MRSPRDFVEQLPELSIMGKKSSLEDKSVLLIEDEPELARILSESITNEGADTTVNANAAEAIASIAAKQFDIVVCDANLPDGDYCTVYGAVAKHSPSSTFVLITGEPDLTAPPELKIAGILRKPNGVLEIGEQIAKMILK